MKQEYFIGDVLYGPDLSGTAIEEFKCIGAELIREDIIEYVFVSESQRVAHRKEKIEEKLYPSKKEALRALLDRVDSEIQKNHTLENKIERMLSEIEKEEENA